MPALFILGRVLFAVLFIYSGATKLIGIQATTEFIASKVAVPAALVPYTSQLETMTGMSTPQTLAIAVGAFEVISGLMIALNIDNFLFPRFLESGAAGQCRDPDGGAEESVDHRRAVHDRRNWRVVAEGGGRL